MAPSVTAKTGVTKLFENWWMYWGVPRRRVVFPHVLQKPLKQRLVLRAGPIAPAFVTSLSGGGGRGVQPLFAMAYKTHLF